MRKRQSFFCVVLFFMFMFNLNGCKKYNKIKKENGNKIDIIIMNKNEEIPQIFNLLKHEYEKTYGKLKIEYHFISNIDQVQDCINKKKGDIIISDRNEMIELSRRSLLGDLSKFYKEDKIINNFFKPITSYGRFNNKYYGIGMQLNSFKVLYNKKSFNELLLKDPNELENFKYDMKKINEKNIKIPVSIKNKEMIYNLIFSSLANTELSVTNLEEVYGNKEGYISISDPMEKIFRNIYNLYKEDIIKEETFQNLNDFKFKEFIDGKIPFIIVDSNYLIDKSISTYGKEIFSLNNSEYNIPILCESLLSISNEAVNKIEVENIIDILYSDYFAEKRAKQGMITGNKKVDKKYFKDKKYLWDSLENYQENNMEMTNTMPKEFYIYDKVEKILKGNYKKNQWEDMIKEVYVK